MARAYKFSEFAKSSLVLILGNVLLKAINFFLLPLYTHYLTPEMLGVSDSVTNLNGFIFPILVFGMDSAYSAYYFDERYEDKRDHIFGTVSQFLKLTSLVPLLGVIFAEKISAILFQSSRYSLIIVMAMIAISVQLWAVPYLLEIRMRNKMIVFSLVNLLSAIVMTMMNVVFIRLFQLGAISLVLSQLLGQFVLFTVLFLYFRKLNLYSQFSRSLLCDLLRFSIPLIPTVALAWVLNLSDRFILLKYWGPDEVGIYGIGARFSAVLNIVVTAVYTAYTPYAFSNKENAEGKNMFRTVLFWVGFLLSLLSLAVSLFSDQIVSLMTAAAYSKSALVVRDLMFSQTIFFAYTIISYGIHFAKKTKYITFITLVGALTNLALNYWLIPDGGAPTAALTTIISYFIMLLLALYYSCKLYPYDYKIMEVAVLFFVSYIGSIILCRQETIMKIVFMFAYFSFIIVWKRRELLNAVQMLKKLLSKEQTN